MISRRGYDPIIVYYNFDAPKDEITKNCEENKAYSVSDRGYEFIDDKFNNNFIERYDDIEYLNIDDDKNRRVNRLPNCPKNLKYLMIPDLHIDRLPELPDGLLYVYAWNNIISHLENLPDSLNLLYINNNFLCELPILPINLTELKCGGNYIRKIDVLPPKLKELHIRNNYLESLPELPETLIWLECPYNPLKVLPRLPNNLRYLAVNNTQIETILNIPPYLHSLDISHTNVSTLPNIGHYHIKSFKAHYSKLREMPSITILDHYININLSSYTGTPLYNMIENEYGSITYRYIYELREKQIKAANKIGQWYLDVSYDPKYANCRKRVMRQFDDDYGDKKAKLN